MTTARSSSLSDKAVAHFVTAVEIIIITVIVFSACLTGHLN